MLTYTTHLKKLILPEYGRHIQDMVDHCLTIDNREERTRCARTIIEAMGVLFPPTGDREAYQQKLWDHLAIMSGFALDVDAPYDITQPEVLSQQPDPVPYTACDFPHRHYGLSIQRMIDVATEMEPGEERDALVELIATHMKKTLSALNPEGVDDAKVFKDLRDLSRGTFNISTDQLRLPEFQILAAPNSKKKRKKK